MKTLLTLTALAVTLSLPTISFASSNVNTFGVELPAEKEATKYELKETDVNSNEVVKYNALGVQIPLIERNFENTYNSHSVDTEKSIVIFGVKVPVNIG